jgi:hypothetical protein
VLLPDNLLLGVACSVERIDSTAPSLNEVDAVAVLDALARRIIDHNRRLLTGEEVDWAALANLLGDAERTCQWLLSRPHGDNPRTDCQ